jgi:hypothetical protein
MRQVVNGFRRRTLRQALQHIVDGIERDEIAPAGGCKYVNDRHDGKPCVIGSLFTPEQRKELAGTRNPINGKRFNSSPVWNERLLAHFGRRNIEFMTGMSVHQASELQALWDLETTITGAFVTTVKKILATGKGRIGAAEFDLDAPQAPIE